MNQWLKRTIGLSSKDCETETSLSPDEIAQSLRTKNQEIISELYALTLDLYHRELERMKSIDAKAATLFGFVTVIVSAVFIVIGFLFDPNNAVLTSALRSGLPFALLNFVFISLMVGFISIFVAVFVKKKWRAPGERDLFEAVHKYDGHVEGENGNSCKPSHDFKRHLIEHFWKLYRANQAVNESKALALQIGQVSVFTALIFLTVLQITLVHVSMEDTMSSTKNNSAADASENTPGTKEPSSRPPALEVSSEGTKIREDSTSRPPAVEVSSKGAAVRNSDDGSQGVKLNEQKQ